MEFIEYLKSDQFTYWLEMTWEVNSMKAYLIALIVFLVIFFGFKIFRRFVIEKIRYLTKKTQTLLDDELITVVEKLPRSFYYVLSLYLPLLFLSLPETVDFIAKLIFIVVVVYHAIKTLQHIIEFLLREYTLDEDEKGMAFAGISMIVKIVLWATGLLLVLSNLGFNITSLVASLGIGGVAVALAVQNILGDIFSSFSIYFDKPFEIEDYIYLDKENQGVVKKIGLKTTRICTLHGQELIISNKDLTSRLVNNYKKMETRRVAVSLGVTYDTSTKKLKKALTVIEKLVRDVKDVEFDRVHFKEFSASSLDFELVYFVLTNDYMVYMDKNQEINFAIKEAFEKAKIEFAFPTQTVYLER